jgi:hypothetical protein
VGGGGAVREAEVEEGATGEVRDEAAACSEVRDEATTCFEVTNEVASCSESRVGDSRWQCHGGVRGEKGASAA